MLLLQFTRVTTEGVKHLVGGLTRLGMLDLSFCADLTGECFLDFPELRHLVVTGSGLTDGCAFHWSALTNLRHLAASGLNELTEGSLACLPLSLHTLEMRNCDALGSLLELGHLRELRSLRVSGSSLPLARRAPRLCALHELHLRIQDIHVDFLQQMNTAFPNLRTLGLEINFQEFDLPVHDGVTDLTLVYALVTPGILRLADSRMLNLERIVLRSCITSSM
jgi:hypothetical protein